MKSHCSKTPRYGFANGGLQDRWYPGRSRPGLTMRCVTAIQDLRQEYDWIEHCVRDIGMLRFEERNDLMPAKKN